MPTLSTPLPVGVTDAEKAALQGSEGTPGSSNKYLTEDDTRANTGPLTGEPTGFPNVTDSVLSFVPATRTFTVAPAVSSFDTYSKGVKQTYSAAQNVVIANTTGLHFVYFNAAGTLVSSLTPWTFGDGLVFVATVYWNTNVTTQYLLGEERHGPVMDWRTHQYLHETRSTVYVSGFALSGYSLDSDTDADVQFGMASGQIDDEDLRHFIVEDPTPTNPFEQILADPAVIPVTYRDGAGGAWVQDAGTTFPFKNTVGGSARVNFNSESGGTWSQTQAANNDFVAYWLFATNDPNNPIISVQGQREDNTLESARANNGFEALNLGDLPGVEWKILYRLIYATSNGFGGTRNAQLAAVDDFRTADLQPGQAAAVTAHSSLSGLATGNDHPQYQLGAEKSTADGYASLDDEVKVPLEELRATGLDDGLISGGATWDSGLTFNVTNLEYVIGGDYFATDPTAVTLATADPTNPRIDVIVADDTGTVSVITGTPAASPVKPEIAPSQVEVTFATVGAGATTPTGVAVQNVFLENAGSGSGEWDYTDNSGTLNPSSTADPYQGSISIEATNPISGNQMFLDPGATYDASADTALEFRLKPKAGWGNSRLYMRFENPDGTPNGRWKHIKHNKWGFDRDDVATHQAVSIPLSEFKLSNPSSVTRLRFYVVKSGGTLTGFFLDRIRLQSGVPVPVAPTFGGNVVTSFDGTVRSSGSTGWTRQVRLSTGAVPAGTYRVGWSYLWNHDDKGSKFQAQVEQDDATQLHFQEHRPVDDGGSFGSTGTSEKYHSSGFTYVTLTAGSHTFDLDFSSDTSGKTSSMWDGRLEFWRVA